MWAVEFVLNRSAHKGCKQVGRAGVSTVRRAEVSERAAMVDAPHWERCRRDVLAPSVQVPEERARAGALPDAVPAGVLRAGARRLRQLRQPRPAHRKQICVYVPRVAQHAGVLRLGGRWGVHQQALREMLHYQQQGDAADEGVRRRAGVRRQERAVGDDGGDGSWEAVPAWGAQAVRAEQAAGLRARAAADGAR